MNYLKAEVDDSNGPVGKKGHGKCEHAKSFGKFAAKGEYGKTNEYGKGYEKGNDKGKKGKGKGPGKDERLAPNSSFAGYCRSLDKWGHKASEC